MAMQQEWYVAIGRHQVGPVSAGEIILNIRNGSMQPTTLIAGLPDQIYLPGSWRIDLVWSAPLAAL